MRNCRAFTLIELMVVVAIIVLLMSLLLPAISSAKQQAMAVKCSSHMSSIGTAFSSYASQNIGIMPQSIPVYRSTDPYWLMPSSTQGLLLSWPEALYIDGCVATGQGNRRGGMNNDASWHYPIAWEKLFQCPNHHANYQYGDDGISRRGYGMAWMAASNFGENIPVRWSQLNPAHIILAEGCLGMAQAGAYPRPSDHPVYAIYGVFLRHLKNNRRAGNYLMADGHVELSDVYGEYSSPFLGWTPTEAQSVPPKNIWVHP